MKFLCNSSLYQLFNLDSNYGGGAIFCFSCNITNNSKGVIFQNNVSRRNGGAIYTHNLKIQDNGPVLFLNNTSNWGAGIQNHGTNSQFYLSADQGDIVFKRNIAVKNDSRNAIHSTPQLNLQIGARQGYSVKFYDPIENEHPSNTALIFNPQSYHSGTVLFSGSDVSPSESSNANNYTSLIQNTAKIAYGTVACEDKAILRVYKMTQEQGVLRLGNGAVISTNVNATSKTTAGCTLTLSRLALNLPSILVQGAQAPKIWIYPNVSSNSYTEDNNPTVTLSGPLLLLNSDNEDPYDSLDLSRGITRIPFLYLCDNTNKKLISKT